ncbi:ATP-binding protein [Streptomyces albus]|uniref:ATP-binding protein n=1 Tax=Streptomyces albus TaxID=1888 RepID=UPI0004C84D7F|nr:ATP-binding protein [Streptomyces albus]
MISGTSTVFFAGHRFHVSVDTDFAPEQLAHLLDFVPEAVHALPCGQETGIRVRRDESLFTSLMTRLAPMPYLPVTPFRGEPYRMVRLQDAVWWRPEPQSHLQQDHLYARDATGLLHVVLHPGAVRGERYLVRMIRETVLRCGENRNWASFHAAAASVTGSGVLIAGPSGAGKTTILTALAAHGRADILASDRAMVSQDAETVVGVPLSVRLAAGTLTGLPTRKAALSAPGLPHVFGTPVKLSRTPRSFARAFGTRVHDSAALHSVVLPRFSDEVGEPAIRYLDAREAGAELASVCCTPHDEDWLLPWFAPRKNTIEELAERANRLVDLLVTHVPVIRLTAGVHAPDLLRKLADAVLRSLP